MKINDLFKYSFVISVDNKRFEWYKKVFTYFKLPISEKICEKIKNQTAEENCGYNHLQCVKIAKERNYPYVLIFEDDAYPRKDINECLDNFIYKLNNCNIKIDLLYLGYYEKKVQEINNIDFLLKPICIYGGHSYIVYNTFYDQYINFIQTNHFLKIHVDWMYKKTKNAYIYSNRIFEQYGCDTKEKNIHLNHKGFFYSEYYKKNGKRVFEFDENNYEKI